MSALDRVSRLLRLPSVYSLFSRLVGKDFFRVYLTQHVRPKPGDRVLDLGCGPADILKFLHGFEFTGVDVSDRYIAAARKRFGARAQFVCTSVTSISPDGQFNGFSLVLATGLVHHLDDEQARAMFRLARLALRDGGCLVTLDGCFVEGQPKLARWLLEHDRGRFVRTKSHYERLASESFLRVEAYLVHNLLRVPYSHLIMRCST
jgi:SAM-dependent methyltransferase